MQNNFTVNVAQTNFDGASFYKEQEFIAISGIVPGPLRDKMNVSLGKRKHRILTVEIPNYISESFYQSYIAGFKLHCSTVDADELLSDLTESDCYALAVVAYAFNDPGQLRRIDAECPIASTTYYWLNLSSEPHLLWPELEVEMYRRRTTKTLDLYDLRENKFSFVNSDSNNFVTLRPEENQIFLLDQTERVLIKNGSIALINKNLDSPLDRLKSYHPEIQKLVGILLSRNCAIRGEFVDSLVNPKYACYAVDSQFRLLSTEAEVLQLYEEVSPEIKDFIQNFDQDDSRLSKMARTQFSYIQEQVYFTPFLPARTLDILGYSVKNIISLVKDIILTNGCTDQGLTSINHTPTMMTVIYHGILLRIHKSVFSSTRDAIAAADINSSRVMLRLENKNPQIVACDSYIQAVTYGINLINPIHRGPDFNTNLYLAAGYFPYLPNGMLSRFDMLASSNAKSNTFGELLSGDVRLNVEPKLELLKFEFEMRPLKTSSSYLFSCAAVQKNFILPYHEHILSAELHRFYRRDNVINYVEYYNEEDEEESKEVEEQINYDLPEADQAVLDDIVVKFRASVTKLASPVTRVGTPKYINFDSN